MKIIQSLYSLLFLFLLLNQSYAQPISHPSTSAGISLPSESFGGGSASLLVRFNQTCMAQSDAIFMAKAKVIYNDGTQQCFVFNRASNRTTGRIEFVLDGISNSEMFTVNFRMVATFEEDCEMNFDDCQDRLGLCCMQEKAFDCCSCGQWEDEVLETFWFEETWPLLPNSFIYNVSSSANRIPGFTSPMQINGFKGGCQCCTY